MQQHQSSSSIRVQRHRSITWADVERPHADDLARLEHAYKLHPVHVQESLQKVQHTRVEHEPHYLFFVLHVPLQSAAGKISVHQIGFFIGKDFLVTIRTGSCTSLEDLYTHCLESADGPPTYFGQGTAYLLYALVGTLLDDISAMCDAVAAELDAMEDEVFDNGGSDALRIGSVRQKIVRLSRVIGPKRLILQDLAEQIQPFAGQNIRKYYANNTKTVDRLWEEIGEAQETVDIYKDADFTTSTERTNKILAVLTIIFTLSIPTTVISGIYGMNVTLPGGLSATPWEFLGRYTTLIITVAGSLVVAVGMYFYFRRKKWF